MCEGRAHEAPTSQAPCGGAWCPHWLQPQETIQMNSVLDRAENIDKDSPDTSKSHQAAEPGTCPSWGAWWLHRQQEHGLPQMYLLWGMFRESGGWTLL